MIRRIIFYFLVLMAAGAAWIVWNHPDWIVAGPPEDFKFSQVASAQPVREQAPEHPVTETANPLPTGPAPVEIKATPLPPVESVPQPPNFKRSDGFENMCTTMPDGSFTTVIIKDYPPTSDLWPYLGEIDPATEAPATAAGSQAWCKEHKPN